MLVMVLILWCLGFQLWEERLHQKNPRLCSEYLDADCFEDTVTLAATQSTIKKMGTTRKKYSFQIWMTTLPPSHVKTPNA